MMNRRTLVFFYSIVLLVSSLNPLWALIVGSKSVASSQEFTIFPSADTNNTLLGFASFENGFALSDSVTTATFDDFMPVSGSINMNNGRLILFQDFCIANEADIVAGGYVEGNNHAFKLPPHPTTFMLPTLDCVEVVPSSTSIVIEDGSAYAAVQTVDWAYTDSYIILGQKKVPREEVQISYYDGTVFTVTKRLEIDDDVYSVRWHPSDYYFSAGIKSRGGNDLEIYYFDFSNGSVNLISGANIGGDVNATAWHPSGNYLVAGSTANAQEIIVYSVTAGVLGSPVITNLSPDQDVQQDALDFSPGGDKLIVGLNNNNTVGIAEILVYNFSHPAALTLTTSANTGFNVLAVDWSPTGSYVAAGLTGGTENLRIYDVSSGVMLEMQEARQGESRSVYDLHWHPSGDYLAVAASTGASNEVTIYHFDKATMELTYFSSISSLSEIFALRWSNNGDYLAYGADLASPGMRMDLATFSSSDRCKLFFEDTVLECNSDVEFKSDVCFVGTSRLNGNGQSVYLLDDYEIVVRPDSHLLIENCRLSNVQKNNLRCLTNSGKITLRNCELYLASDFTFSQGSIMIEPDVILSGTNVFNYTTPLTSTIANGATLLVDIGVTFKYDPSTPNKNLIYMEGADSSLYFNGSTLHTTQTGLALSGGNLFIDDLVTFSSEAQVVSEGISLDESLNVCVRGGAVLDLYGYIIYE